MSDPKSPLIISCPPEILTLAQNFHEHADDYKSGKYNEAQLRQQFLNPMFEALGWDLANKSSTAEAYKDVVHEDAIKIGQETKAPDYCFRIGGTRKFFLEAKKPSVHIKEDIPAAFQLRRYAWSAKLPLSILCDFEEFAVYDTRIKPDKNDKASTARILYLTYKDYSEKWHEIASVFSKEAVLKGSFDKYAESTRLKKGTATVDDAFLTEIEDWRDLLARNIAIRNPDLSQRELNFAVQRTIDRIVFLRICEDRGIENYGRLQALQNGTNSYKRLVQLFSQADDRYNSGLFHFQKEKGRHEEPDTLTTKIEIDDKPLKEIIKRLYYPESPYEFSVLSADILGQVYEQFLGKVIRLTAGHQAKVEEKPEVRKAGGVYYTPKYIVDYIVKNTVGQLLNPPLEKGGKGGFEASDVNPPQSPFVKGGNSITPKEAAKLRILDPACGSGSFLLGAYQYLLDWHQEWYVNDDPKKWAIGKNPVIYQALGGDYRLTTAERKRILLNNIYGVDIDSQAVEVTKLSLLLKVLEGETNQTLQSTFIHERALPDLGDNIKCGNSLIGSDFYQQQTMLDDEERYRVNVFDWKKEFAEIMNAGGFDAVIGNPPYGAELSRSEIDYISQNYAAASYQYDTYPLFLEKAYELAKPKGFCSLIVPSAWVASKYDEKLRHFLAFETSLVAIVIAPKKAFKDATVETLIIVFSKATPSKSTLLIERWDKNPPTVYCLSQDEIKQSSNNIFSVYVTSTNSELIKKIAAPNEKLSAFADAVWGVKVYQKGKGRPPQEGHESTSQCFHSSTKRKRTHKPLLGGSEIRRYVLDWAGGYVDYGEWLAEPRTPEWFEGHRILVREVTAKGTIQATLVDGDFVFSNSVDGIRLKKDTKYALQFILGVVNSQLMSFYHLNTSANAFKGSFPKLLVKDILSFPLPALLFSNANDKARHDKIVSLVDQMLSLNKHLPDAKTDHEKTALQRQIDATDQQIDQLAYELYGLTEEEVKIVEEAQT